MPDYPYGPGVSPHRVQRKRTKDWRLPPHTRCVNRGSRWGNPFYLWPQRGCTIFGQPWGRLALRPDMPSYVSAYMFDDVAYASFSDRDRAVAHAVDLFRIYCRVRERDIPDKFAAWLDPLRGQSLACYCPLDAPCHADVLLELANA